MTDKTADKVMGVFCALLGTTLAATIFLVLAKACDEPPPRPKMVLPTIHISGKIPAPSPPRK